MPSSAARCRSAPPSPGTEPAEVLLCLGPGLTELGTVGGELAGEHLTEEDCSEADETAQDQPQEPLEDRAARLALSGEHRVLQHRDGRRIPDLTDLRLLVGLHQPGIDLLAHGDLPLQTLELELELRGVLELAVLLQEGLEPILHVRQFTAGRVDA